MKYDAFISYRHAELDLSIAKKLHKGLETLRVPGGVAEKSGKKSIKRVFRDQEELPIGSSLTGNIEAALRESEFLIVICSPRTPESEWVAKEITTFIKMHDREHILAVLIEGEPEQAFPEQLLRDEEGNRVEPLAADVRGATGRERNRKMKTELMRLAAPLLHCSYDDLRQRHRERRMKRAAVISGAVAVSALLFGAYSAYNASLIRQNYAAKQRNQSKYLADTSLRLLEEGDRRAAVLVALNALPSEKNDRPYVAEAQYALSRALLSYDTGSRIQMDRVLRHDLPVRDFWMNSEGTLAVSIDQGNSVYVWNVEDGHQLIQVPPRTDEDGDQIRVNKAILNGENLIICEENALRSLTPGGEENWCVESSARINACIFHEETAKAACIGLSEVDFYDLSNGEKVGVMQNESNFSYSAEAAFAGDGMKFAAAHLITDQEETAGAVSLYDFQTQENTELSTGQNYIVRLAFTADGNLAAAQARLEELGDTELSAAVGILQKFDCKNRTLLWQREYEYQGIGTDNTGVILQCREYEDSEARKQDEVIMSVDNFTYVWNSEDGAAVSEIRVNSGIMCLLAAGNSRFGYLGQSDGTIEIADMTSGKVYVDQAVETRKKLRDMRIENGVLVMRSYASPDLTVMKYHEGEGRRALEKYETSVSRVEYSADESFYAVSLFGDGEKNSVLFYRTEDHSLIGEWTQESSSAASAFMDDKCYAAVGRDGRIVFYDLESGLQEILNTEDELFVSVQCDINHADGERMTAFLYRGSQYCIVDLQARAVICRGGTEGYIESGVISPDGRLVYCSMKESGVCILDTEAGTVSPIELPGYQLQNTVQENAFAVSKSGKLLAVSCRDGILRVFDTEKQETAAEIPFAGGNHRFIKFCKNDTQLMLQGEDYYFRVFDLKSGQIIYLANEQYYKIQQAVFNQSAETVSLITLSDMIVLNAEDYERIAQIDGGKAYFPKHAEILCEEGRQMYQFPYMTLAMLREDAGRQFGGEQLTELERIGFHVE